METEKYFQLLSSATPQSKHKFKRKPKITKLSLKKKIENNLSDLEDTHMENRNYNINNMSVIDLTKSDDEILSCSYNTNDKVCKKSLNFNDKNVCKERIIFNESDCDSLSFCFKNDISIESQSDQKNVEEANDNLLKNKLNLTNDRSDDSVLTDDISSGARDSNDFVLVLTSDDSGVKHEELDNKKELHDNIYKPSNSENLNNSVFSSINDLQPSQFKNTITSIIAELDNISEDFNKTSKCKSNIRISLSRTDFEDWQKNNEVLVPETQEDDCDKIELKVPCIIIEESETESIELESDCEKNNALFTDKAINITIEESDMEPLLLSEDEINEAVKKSDTSISDSESYATAILCKDSPLKYSENHRKNKSTLNKIKDVESWIQSSKVTSNSLCDSPKLKNTFNSTYNAEIQGVCDSSSQLTTSNENNLSKSDQELLDQLYGKTWRMQTSSILSKSETKNKPKNNTSKILKNCPQTERKQKSNKKVLNDSSRFSTFSPSFESTRHAIEKDLLKQKTKKKTKKTDFIISDDSDDHYTPSYFYNIVNKEISDNSNSKSCKSIKDNAKPKYLQQLKNICDSDTDDDEQCNEKSNFVNSNNKLETLKSDRNYSSESEPECNFKTPAKNFKNKKGGLNTGQKKKPLYTPEESSINIIPNLSRFKNSSSDSDNENVKPFKIGKSVAKKSEVLQKLTFLQSLSGCIAATSYCHPEALKYKKKFKQFKEELSQKLFNLYNSTIFDNKISNDTPIEWNTRMRGTAGFCYNKRIIKNNHEIERSSRIVLSTKVIDNPGRLRDTLIHEMCHAATWLINGIHDGHGPKWKAWASKAVRIHPDLPPLKRCHDYEISTKYTYKCVQCGYSIGRHSKSLNTERKVCGYCHGKFELLVNKKNKDGVITQTVTPSAKKANAFAMFVKENYGSVKKEKNLNHGDVMRILSEKFSEVKVSTK